MTFTFGAVWWLPIHLENDEDLTFGKSLLCSTFSYTYVVQQHPYLMTQELIRPSRNMTIFGGFRFCSIKQNQWANFRTIGKFKNNRQKKQRLVGCSNRTHNDRNYLNSQYGRKTAKAWTSESRNNKQAALYQKFETYIPRNETLQPRSIFLHSWTVSWSDLYIPTVSNIWNHYFPVLCERTLNRRSGEKGRALPPSSGWQQFPTLPAASAMSRDFT